LSAERKAFLREFVEGNLEAAKAHWAAIDDPADAFRLYLAAAEFVFPKLGRTEVTGEDGGALTINIVKASHPGGSPGNGPRD
jgi:hypothetical protein